MRALPPELINHTLDFLEQADIANVVLTSKWLS